MHCGGPTSPLIWPEGVPTRSAPRTEAPGGSRPPTTGFVAEKKKRIKKVKAKKVRVKKDNGKMTRPQNSFMLWAGNKYGNRRRIQQENPGLPNKEVSRLVGEQWKSLSKEQRIYFQNEARELREVAKANGYTQCILEETRAKKLLLPTAKQIWGLDVININPETVDFETLAKAVYEAMQAEDLKKVQKAAKAEKKKRLREVAQ